MKSRHGLEIHRYSSPNCLSVDLLTNDACREQEKTFREMLEQQEQHVRLPQSIFTAEYYRRRYENLLQSCQRGPQTHDQWAEQNYQLHCLKTLYTQAVNREQQYFDRFTRQQRQRRAQHVYQQWKEEKNGESQSRPKTGASQRTTELSSVSSNLSFSNRSATTNRLSSSTVLGTELEEPLVVKSKTSLKDALDSLYMVDRQRSSLQGMLKRIVGLAEPLRPPPKISEFGKHRI